MDSKAAEFEIIPLKEWQQQRFPYWYHGQDLFNILIPFDDIEICLANDSFCMEGNTLIFIGPAKDFTLRGSGTPNGYLIRFTSRFYERSALDRTLINSGLFFDSERLLKVVKSQIKKEEMKMQIMGNIQGYQSRNAAVTSLIVHNFIESVLLQGIWETDFDKELPRCRDSTVQGMANRFSILVHKHYKENCNVKFYADKLHITPRKLTNLCTEVWNKTAKNAIIDIVLKEALRYIENTDLSISQISYEMGFSDESNFRHFIKKHSGSNPLQYRDRMRAASGLYAHE
jgi:AraC-like DNA-binding protein